MAADSTQHVRDDKTAQKRKTTKDPHSHKTKKLKKGSSKTLKVGNQKCDALLSKHVTLTELNI